MTTNFFHRCLLATLLAAATLFTGCAQIKLGAPVASVDNIEKAKTSGMAAVAVGDFRASPAVKDDAGINVRSNTVSSPVQGSFAQYLKENLSVELRSAGLLEPTSKTVVSGELTQSQLDAASSQGTGSLAARFVVSRGGAAVYEKELRVQASWESSFIGGVAIPAAINNYTALYRALIAKLLDDADFRKAVKG